MSNYPTIIASNYVLICLLFSFIIFLSLFISYHSILNIFHKINNKVCVYTIPGLIDIRVVVGRFERYFDICFRRFFAAFRVLFLRVFPAARLLFCLAVKGGVLLRCERAKRTDCAFSLYFFCAKTASNICSFLSISLSLAATLSRFSSEAFLAIFSRSFGPSPTLASANCRSKLIWRSLSCRSRAVRRS